MSATTRATVAGDPSAAPSSRTRSRRGGRSVLWQGLTYLALTVTALVFVAPIAYMLIGSFKPSGQVISGLGGFVPSDLSLDNYTGMLARFDSDATGRFRDFYSTSLIVSTVAVVGGLLVNSIGAYALARLRWHGRDAVLLIVVALVILPFEAITVPMSKPVFATVTILSFLTSWGSFLWPVMMVDQPQRRPLPLEIAVFQGQPPTEWGQIFAFGVLLVLPVLLVFLLFQRWFVQSFASSGMKG